MDPTFSSRCTHLLCESQVSSAYAQVSAVASALTAAGSVPSRGPSKGSRDMFGQDFLLPLKVGKYLLRHFHQSLVG